MALLLSMDNQKSDYEEVKYLIDLSGIKEGIRAITLKECKGTYAVVHLFPLGYSVD